MSTARSTLPRAPAAIGSSRATPMLVRTKTMIASGMLMKNSARQPQTPTSTPPSGRPMTTVTWAAIEKLPSTRLGTPSPTLSARFRTSAMAVG